MDVVDLAGQLISFDSTSSRSNVAISEFLADHLARGGFELEVLTYRDVAGVEKRCLVAKRGQGRGGVAWFGHTDTVPAAEWTVDGPGPFAPLVRGGRLYGRGSCDMKGSMACMVVAAERTAGRALPGPLYLVCTADEEVGFEGARQVAEHSELFREMVSGGTRGVIGEPTGLTVVHGHKGSYAFRVVARGRAAHSSTREGENANWRMIPFLQEMKRMCDRLESDPAWCDTRFDPPTVSWNLGINDFTRAVNVTPAQSVCTVHFRPMPGQDEGALIVEAREAARRHGLEFELFQAGPPFYADPDSPWTQAMLRLTGTERAVTVPYGTDASFLSALASLVICGPGSIAQAHTSDEWIALEQLHKGVELYERLIQLPST